MTCVTLLDRLGRYLTVGCNELNWSYDQMFNAKHIQTAFVLTLYLTVAFVKLRQPDYARFMES